MRFSVVCSFLGASLIAAAQSKQPIDPHTLVLAGGRLAPLHYDSMTAEQKTMVDHLLTGPRAGVRGPFDALLRSPVAGDRAAEYGEYMRFRTDLPKDVSEIIITTTGRFWMAQYEWNAHKAAALRAGVKPEIVEAIATGKRPAGMSPKMEAAYNFIDELLTTHQVSNATFQAAKDAFGEKGIVDMTGLSGWYSLVSMILDTDEYPLGAGVQPELKPLENPLPVAQMGFGTPVPGPVSPKVVTFTLNNKTLTVRGDRFRPLTYDEMTPAAKKYAEIVAAGRGPGATFNLFLRSPEAGQLFFSLGEAVRFHMSIPDKDKELALAITARYWAAQTEWNAHSRAAIQAGLSADTAKAIAEGRRPSGMAADETAVYNLLTEFFKTKQVSDATFAAAKTAFGERGVIDLLVSSAYYQIVSMFMNVDRLPLAAGQQPGLKYLAKPLP